MKTLKITMQLRVPRTGIDIIVNPPSHPMIKTAVKCLFQLPLNQPIKMRQRNSKGMKIISYRTWTKSSLECLSTTRVRNKQRKSSKIGTFRVHRKRRQILARLIQMIFSRTLQNYYNTTLSILSLKESPRNWLKFPNWPQKTSACSQALFRARPEFATQTRSQRKISSPHYFKKKPRISVKIWRARHLNKILNLLRQYRL